MNKYALCGLLIEKNENENKHSSETGRQSKARNENE